MELSLECANTQKCIDGPSILPRPSRGDFFPAATIPAQEEFVSKI
jgi:hypothetical protein